MIIKLGEKILAPEILTWLPVSTDIFFGKPLVISACFNYMYSSKISGTATTVVCSKEFIKALVICKKIFDE